MSTAADEKKAKKPLLPPDEQFWKRYSPHHEFPLATATALFVYGLVLGISILWLLWVAFQLDSDSNKPVSMDVVMLAAGCQGFFAPQGTICPGLSSDREYFKTQPRHICAVGALYSGALISLP